MQEQRDERGDGMGSQTGVWLVPLNHLDINMK